MCIFIFLYILYRSQFVRRRKMYARKWFKCCDCKNIQSPQISSLRSHVDCRTTYDRFQMIIFIYKYANANGLFFLFRRLVNIFFPFSFYLVNCILFRFLWICSNNKIMKSMCDISAWRRRRRVHAQLAHNKLSRQANNSIWTQITFALILRRSIDA